MTYRCQHRAWDLGPSARRVWRGRPEPLLRGLAAEGFEEYKRETAWGGRPRVQRGGLWQGLNRQTGEVASAIWVAGATDDEAVVFVDIAWTCGAGGDGSGR